MIFFVLKETNIMKKTLRIIIAMLTASFMLMTFAACDEKKEDTVSDNTFKEDTIMKAVYEDITSDENYISWKEMYPESTIEEKLDGSTLTFTVKGLKDYSEEEEGDITNDREITNGEYVFTHDGDYILCASGYAETFVNPFVVQVRNAVCDYYKISIGDVNDYLMANTDNTYYIEDMKNNVIKIYVAEKWNLG